MLRAASTLQGYIGRLLGVGGPPQSVGTWNQEASVDSGVGSDTHRLDDLRQPPAFLSERVLRDHLDWRVTKLKEVL